MTIIKAESVKDVEVQARYELIGYESIATSHNLLTR